MPAAHLLTVCLVSPTTTLQLLLAQMGLSGLHHQARQANRPNGLRLQSVSNAEWKTGKRPDFSVVKDGGVLYVLDEVHIAFNARA